MTCFTIYTDASLCPWTKAAAWGAWMRDQNGSHRFTGLFGIEMQTSTDAEMAAVGYAMREALRIFPIRSGDALIFVTDCEAAKRRIVDRHCSRTKLQNTIRNYLFQTLPDGVALRVNRVKGHSTHDGARSYVNGVVHDLALQTMRLERRRREQEARAVAC